MFLVIFAVAQLERPDRRSRRHPLRAVLRAVDRRVRHLLRVLREPRDHDAVPSGDGSAEAGARDAASARRLPQRARREARCSSARCSRSSSPSPASRSTECTSTAARLLPLLITFAVASASCCALGLALSTLVPNADAAPAIVNFIYFPIVFISGTFFPVNQTSVLAHIASVFPVRHVILAVFAGFDPRRSGRELRVGPSRGRRGVGRRRASSSRSAASAGNRRRSA